MSRSMATSSTRGVVLWVLTMAVIAIGVPAWAVEPAGVDTFEDGTEMGWAEGVPSPNPPSNVPTAGPRGVGDAYLQNSSAGGSGAGSRLVMFNRTQWTGDFSSAGVTSLAADLINLGPNPLPIRIGVEGSGGGRFVSTFAAMLPADATWREVEFELSDAEMTLVDGSQSLAAVLGNVTELRILASDSPDWSGDPMDATLGMDNLRPGAVIFVDGFESGGTSLWEPAALAADAFEAVAQVGLSIPASGVLGNDPAPGYSTLSAELVSGPSDPNGSVTLFPDGSFDYLYGVPIGSPVTDSFTYRVDGGLDGDATVSVTVVPEPTLTDLRVSYRLDPWLIPGQWGSGFWVSPITFGPARQAGDVFVMEVRADAEDNGTPVESSPTWIPADPSMVTFSPSHGEHVVMTVWATGESQVVVDAQGVRSTLAITASRYQGTAMEVVIYQP
jgi:hypothetical protein